MSTASKWLPLYRALKQNVIKAAIFQSTLHDRCFLGLRKGLKTDNKQFIT